MANSGDAIFANLALIFAIGVAIGFSKDSNGAAGLAGATGFLVLTNGTQAINKEIDMGVLGGILSGIIAGLLYNRYHEVKLPQWLGFFSGKRFVPIVTAATMVVLAFIFGFAWPPVQEGINSIGQWIIDAGALGVGVYGFLNRLLIPVGLHHVINSLVWFVFGDFNGATGDLNRFFAHDPDAGIFIAGFFPIMMFGLPAASLAMIAAAKASRRKEVTGLLIGMAFTSFLTGITEPIEFSFMFLSPLLYGVHALLTASSFVITYVLDIHHGFGFSAGAIDYILNFGIAQRALLLLGIGLIYGAVYFVIFYFLIKKFNLKTPGREDEEELDKEEDSNEEWQIVGSGDKYDEMASHFLNDLGGRENITSLDNCATRLRMTVKDMSTVNETKLKRHGARGVMKLNKTNLQVIVGTDVEFVSTAMKKQISQKSTPAIKEESISDQSEVDQKLAPLNGEDFAAPIGGKLISLTEVPDEVFSQKMMGDGLAIEPTDNTVVAPADGEIINIFPTKHAIGLRLEQGYELLIHFGLDTVKLDGKGFEAFVTEGMKVKKGQELIKIDLDYVKQNIPSIITPIVFTNLPEGTSVNLEKTGIVRKGTDGIITVS
ncbi:glucose PTS transporter subunit IIA [Alkalihalobacillus sp. TS-13]|uniref:glucose PTS transporter subunit IIA n=1 Tax=Alkalihalobacillus sp. TS-13 TaxID=2842455 RepID=UPI001C86E1BD|nr:glucose PTS transporter subunit IIA [Alkalihalobacillus sp. TS-13]